MSFSTLLSTSMRCLLRTPVLDQLAGKLIGKRILQMLKEHLIFSSHDLASAYQHSIVQTLKVIETGLRLSSLSPNTYNEFTTNTKKLLSPKVYREFTDNFEVQYLVPFVQTHQLQDQALKDFVEDTSFLCVALAKQANKILPEEQFSNFDIASITRESQLSQLSNFLLAQMKHIVDIHQLTCEFFIFKELLGTAMLHFFCERMRLDQRVQRTIFDLKQDGLWTELRDIQRVQEQICYELSSQKAEISQQQQEYNTKLSLLLQESRHEEMIAVIQAQKILKEQLDENAASQKKLFEQIESIHKPWADLIERIDHFATTQALHFDELLGIITQVEESLHHNTQLTQETHQEARKLHTKIDEGIAGLHDKLNSLLEIFEKQSSTILAPHPLDPSPTIPTPQVAKGKRPTSRPNWIPKLELTKHVLGVEASVPLTLKIPPALSGTVTRLLSSHSGQPLIELSLIETGCFWMGASNEEFVKHYGPVSDFSRRLSSLDKESKRWKRNYAWMMAQKPQRRIQLSRYWISRTPVTNRMWQIFLEESNYSPNPYEHDGNYLKHWPNYQMPSLLADHPVTYISYYNAWAFCDYYQLALPSEAQWEKAARGSDSRIWPWGDTPPTAAICNYRGSGINSTSAVTQFPRGQSPYSLLDCAGNIFEWCFDCWDNGWLTSLTDDELDPVCQAWNQTSKRCSLRGGSFGGPAEFIRCACRNTSVFPETCRPEIGFRPIMRDSIPTHLPHGVS